MITYRIEKTVSNTDVIVRSNEDGSETWIPTDSNNSDYQAYLASLDEASTL